MWLLFALLSAVFAALVTIFGKVGIKGIDSTLATTVRALIMAGFLLLASLVTGRLGQFGSIDSRSLKFIVFSGVAGAISWLFYFAALRLGLASRVATIDRLSLVFILVFAAMFLGETLTIKSVLGITLITLGAILTII